MADTKVYGNDIDDAVIGGTTPAAGTFTTLDTTGAFTSLGIDDNADATAITIDSSKNMGLGVTTFGTSATYTFAVSADGTVPSTSPAGMVQIFADDSSDGAANATLAIRTEQAVEAIGTFTGSHKLKIYINGTEYWIELDAV